LPPNTSPDPVSVSAVGMPVHDVVPPATVGVTPLGSSSTSEARPTSTSSHVWTLRDTASTVSSEPDSLIVTSGSLNVMSRM
jgi:hypothetical protein